MMQTTMVSEPESRIAPTSRIPKSTAVRKEHGNAWTLEATISRCAGATKMCDPVVTRNLGFHAISRNGLPFHGRAHIAFLPHGKTVESRVLAHVVESICSRPITQERMTVEIHDVLARALTPRGVFVVLEGQHMGASWISATQTQPVVRTRTFSGGFEDAEVRSSAAGLM